MNPNETCHGCNTPQKGGIVTPCSFCGTWGLFCSACQVPFNEGSCSLTRTLCAKSRLPVREAGPRASGDRNYFSASQLESYADCPRKWAWRYIDGIQTPPNPFATFGLAVHAQIEKYLKHGTPFDLTTDHGEAAMAGLHLLPQPGTAAMTVEAQFTLDGWGHKFLGYKDVQVNGPIPLVIDHKTTGNFKWAKTPDELRVNIQAVIYATHAMVQTGAEACDLRWIYYKRHKPFGSKPVDLRVTRADLEPALTTIKGLADEMALIKLSGKRAIELPPNPGACGAYGGCPYVKNCDLSPQEKMHAIMSQASLDDRKNAFLASMGRGPAGGAGTNVNPPNQGQPPQGQFQPPPNQGPPPGYQPQGQPPAGYAPPPNQGPPPGYQPQGQPPSGQPPQGQFQPPPNQGPPGPPADPQVDEQVLIQARGVHPNWIPGTQWWNGQAYVQPNDPAYPPIFVQPPSGQPPQGAPPNQGQPQNGQPAAGADQGGAGKGGRPKKNAEAVALAAEAARMMSTAWTLFAQAVDKGLFG